MILDYYYNEKQRRFDISYVDDKGGKQLLQFNVNRFKSFYKTPTGPYDSWDGAKCDVKWTEKPSNFDLKYYIKEMDPQYKSLLEKKTFPKVYTFDIETWIPEDNEFPEPSTAKFPITTISIVSPEMNCVVLATRELNQDELKYVSDSFDNYLDNTAFFKELKLSKKPSFKYIKFDTEEQMLEFFLKNIVARVPIIAGWNSLFFDWYYITTRIKNYYPNLSVRMASITNRTYNKRLVDVRGDAIYLPMPEHTLILDMMDVIKSEDYVVLPIKESYGLDYIAHESMGINKIEYDGTLQDLYNSDYPKYVYYNAIDSILVQLIDKRFKTLDHIYMYSLYCEEKIGRCFSKIATTEALVFQDFYERGLKIVYEPKEVVERGHLIGAYVKKPIPGLHEFVCCNDFASLYPSTIRTCNLSFENFICSYWDQKKIAEYAEHPEKYIIIGPNVFKNEGTLAKPATGVQIDTCLDEEKLAPYRENKDYFVSVNGSIYKNDKDYTFRRIQGQLKANRDSSKYLAKQLEATVILDMEHILAGRRPNQVYNERIRQALKKIDVDAECGEDLLKYDNDFLSDKMHELKSEITYYSCHEQAMKLLMNSMYGGSSHVSFYWFNMELANDITGESRNLIHSMENHIPAFWRDNWTKMTDLHKKLGIEIDPKAAEEALLSSPLITKEQDPNAFHDHSYVYAAYGDSCTGDTLISTTHGQIKIEDLFNKSSVAFVDRDKEFAMSDFKIFNFDGRRIVTNNIKYIIRHKTNKSKWIISTKDDSIVVTGDHSMIIYEDGEMKTIKPSEMILGMTVITQKGFEKVTDVQQDDCFNDEYVYDIEVLTNNENMHNFFGNNILIHNTDSVSGDTIIHTDHGDKTIQQMFDENDDAIFHTHKGHELTHTNDKVLNWNDKLYYGRINYIMRHKVSKPKWRLKTKSSKEIIVTNDHSMIVFRNGQKLEVKPYEILKTDKILVVLYINKYDFEDIEVCECIGEFEDEYVYDIEMDDDTHTFIANDILVHNSLYLSYGYLLRSIKGYKDMSIEQKRDIVVRLNTEFLDNHNYEFIKNYYDKRHGKSVHNFELETVALSGIWGEVKKRYAQILLWKDGKVFDIDNLPLKVKGLEVVKSSFPKTSRNMLKQLYIYLLSHAGEKYLIQNLNLEVQKLKKQFFEADVESISGSVKVNGYKKYIKSDNEDVIKYNPVRACPWNTRALATYNWLRNKNKLSGEPISGGLVKWYICNLNGRKSQETEYFAFHAANLPKWSQDYAPIDRAAMFQQTVLDPINRMLAANKIPLLNIDGYIQMSLF